MTSDKSTAPSAAILKADDVDEILRVLWYTPGIERWGLPSLVVGPPGTAKTFRVKALCRAFGLHGVPVLASLRQPEDFLGMPIPVRDPVERDRLLAWVRARVPGAKAVEHPDGIMFCLTEYAPPRWAVEAAAAGRACVILDEANRTPPAVQSALLRVVLEGVVGDFVLPSTVRFTAIMNPAGSSGTWDLSDALANRFGHFVWPTPTVQAWAQYMSGAGRVGAARADAQAPRDGAELEAYVEANWASHYAESVGMVAGFMSARPNLFHDQPEDGDPASSGAWPSPRTWDMATRAVASARLHGLSASTQLTLASAFVGPGAGAEFATWVGAADLPDPVRLLDGEVQWSHNPARLDRTVAVLQSCATFVMQSPATDPKRVDRAAKLWGLMKPIVETAPDVCLAAAEPLSKGRLGITTPDAQKVGAKLWPTVDATKGIRKAG